ncbi:hypothetical protein GOODEAATRI_029078 [Goodea atripinnis]|uniref:Uncharacterized protein n=1 Tax=Goodea atripinnis TaxID=208336 RepID=A0ABV0P1F5_9TELE
MYSILNIDVRLFRVHRHPHIIITSWFLTSQDIDNSDNYSRVLSQWESTTHTDTKGAIIHVMRHYNTSQRSSTFWGILVGRTIIRTNQVIDGIKSTSGFNMAKPLCAAQISLSFRAKLEDQ